MALTLTRFAQFLTLDHDTVIDVRAPGEFAIDHVPGAINLPVLDDAERARVGTIYKQVNAFSARKIGAALVARNVAGHLETVLADMPGSWRPLIYCWRGGQRSGSFEKILSQVGWRTDILAGGYKTFRALVAEVVYDHPVPSPVIRLDGYTGTAKTELLALLAQRGVQVIDLEGLAHHRGSLFGARAEQQPSQKAFETRLAVALTRLDPARPVVIEAESSKIGTCLVPKQLWMAMRVAPGIEVRAPTAARADYLIRAYADIIADPVALATAIDRLRPYQSAEVVARWHAQAQAGDYHDLAADLMTRHYDPRYEKHAAGAPALDAPSLAPDALPALAEALADRVADLGQQLSS